MSKRFLLPLLVLSALVLSGCATGRFNVTGGWAGPVATEELVYIGSGDAASRTLLVGGLLLIVTGFFYGLGYATFLEFGNAPSEVDILKKIVIHAAAADNTALNVDFGAFGNYQMLRAISSSASLPSASIPCASLVPV